MSPHYIVPARHRQLIPRLEVHFAEALPSVQLRRGCHGTVLQLTHSLFMKKTGLYDFHTENGVKMVPFVGTLCPSTMGTLAKVNKIPISAGFALRLFPQLQVITMFLKVLELLTLGIWFSASETLCF